MLVSNAIVPSDFKTNLSYKFLTASMRATNPPSLHSSRRLNGLIIS
jgi:hypothetical protein